MAQLVIILGALTALNLGFSVLTTDDPEETQSQGGDVQVEEVEASAQPAAAE